MTGSLLASLRGRLLLVVLLPIVPALGLTVLSHLEQGELERARTRAEVQRLVQVASLDQQRVIEGTRQLLTALARVPDMRVADPATCSAFLADLFTYYEGYTNFGRTDRTGNLICSATPITQPVYVGDREWHQRVLASGDFARGEYQIGRVTGRANLVQGYPVRDPDGAIIGVVYAGLSLEWLNRLVAASDLPSDSVVAVYDSDGHILARYPDGARWTGATIGHTSLMRALLAESEGIAAAVAEDDVERLYAFAPLGGVGAPEYIAIGFSRATIEAEAWQRLARNLLGLLAVGVIALAVGRWLGEALLLRGMSALVAAAHRLRAGDLGARTGWPHSGDELGHLAAAFDSMAATLEQRDAELRAANDELEARVAERTAQLRATNAELAAQLAERERVEAALREARLAQGRLEGVQLAARELAHLLNNALAPPLAACELIKLHPDAVPAHIREMIEEGAQGLARAKEHVRQFQQVVRVETKQTPVGPALDLSQSVDADRADPARDAAPPRAAPTVTPPPGRDPTPPFP